MQTHNGEDALSNRFFDEVVNPKEYSQEILGLRQHMCRPHPRFD